MVIKRKVLVYITYQNRLLIFTHPDFPEAGIQVPGGTLRDDESPEAGALREAIEETVLTSLRVVACLGEVQRDMSDFGMAQLHHRYFYHLTCDEAPPETWWHGEFESADGSREPIVFEFGWAALPDGVPPLIAGHDALIPELWRRLNVQQ